MKKIDLKLLLVILIGILLVSGCIDQQKDNDKESTETEVSQQEAVDILMRDVINPSSSEDRLSAYMPSMKLKKGDVITSESGNSYPIDKNTWFIYIDDMPGGYFAHPTRYILIDVDSGEITTIDELWPPFLNNISIWDTKKIGGNLIEIYHTSISSVPINVETSGNAPVGDYGDAPDGQNAYYGVQGRFPTLYNTSNSRAGLPGGFTLNIGEETIGLHVSAETDANDSNDPDLTPNLVNSDSDERIFIHINGSNAKLSFTITVDKNAPDVARYVNVLIDFDQNGNWSYGSHGSEWPIKNLGVNVSPGSSITFTTPSFMWGSKSILSSPVWMRLALTREKVDETIFSGLDGWDGSGQYNYGEIEDHLVYLMENPPEPEEEWPPWPGNPPGGKNPNPPQPPGPNPPGPAKGPCGTDVNYHVIIINGGDSSSHISQGQNPAEQAVDKVSDLVDDQGYNTVGNLGPGKSGSSGNSLDNIGNAIDNLKSNVKCGDHVLIYIVGHGNPSSSSKGPGINLKGSDGKTNELLTPSILASFLGKIPACPGEECDTPGKCCHVTVVIESCYAGNFNVDGVKGEGRTVMGSCDDEPADATNGGAFTSGFVEGSGNNDNDNNDDDSVDPSEAYGEAENNVEDNNDKTGRNQEPWTDSQECECICPCKPSIDVDKYVWNDNSGEWDDEINAYLGEIVFFKCDLENDGKCRNVTNLSMIDEIPICLSYENDAVLYINDLEIGSFPPSIEGQYLNWDFTEFGEISPGESISIEYSARTEILGENINYIIGSAQCTYDTSIFVDDDDTAIVNVQDEPQDLLPPIEVLFAYFNGSANSTWIEDYCSSTVSISYGADDLTGGDYLVANVVILINGIVHPDGDSGSLSTISYENSIEFPAECGETFDIEIIATNEFDQVLSVTGSITTPIPEI